MKYNQLSLQQKRKLAFSLLKDKQSSFIFKQFGFHFNDIPFENVKSNNFSVNDNNFKYINRIKKLKKTLQHLDELHQENKNNRSLQDYAEKYPYEKKRMSEYEFKNFVQEDIDIDDAHYKAEKDKIIWDIQMLTNKINKN